MRYIIIIIIVIYILSLDNLDLYVKYEHIHNK